MKSFTSKFRPYLCRIYRDFSIRLRKASRSNSEAPPSALEPVGKSQAQMPSAFSPIQPIREHIKSIRGGSRFVIAGAFGLRLCIGTPPGSSLLPFPRRDRARAFGVDPCHWSRFRKETESRKTGRCKGAKRDRSHAQRLAASMARTHPLRLFGWGYPL